jgi:hypothetical protein
VLSDYARQIGEARTAEQPPQPAAIPKAQPLDTQTADPVRTPDAGTEPAAAKPAQAPQTGEVKPETAPSPAEQNVRQAAIEKPDTVVHLDANAGPQEGKISDLLKTIDDEHQATLQDASLLQVAANCFIGSGD